MAGARLKKLARRSGRTVRFIMNLDYALQLPPWSELPAQNDTVGRLRRQALPADATRLVRILRLLHGVYWPLRASLDATLAVGRYGAQVKRLSGIGHRRQWWRSMALAHRLNYSPNTYYTYRFWRPDTDVTQFVQPDEMSALQTRTVGRRSVLASKERFEEICAAADLPTPPTIATIRPGTSDSWTGAVGTLPRRDLFVKPLDGKQGWGCERWEYEATSEAWSRRATSLTEGDFLRRLANRPYAVTIQHALSNHDELTQYSTTTLATFRVMTYRAPGSNAWPIAVALKVPRAGADVDNLHVGGYLCSVDIETGRLAAGWTMKLGEDRHRTHADTGAALDGAIIELHREAVALALEAHERLDVPRSVGWDVAVTPDGPILIEGNAKWAVALYHLASGNGLDEKFARAFLDEVQASGEASFGQAGS